MFKINVLLLNFFYRNHMDGIFLGVHAAGYSDFLSFVPARQPRIVEVIVDTAGRIIQGKMIAVGSVAIPRKGFVFPFDGADDDLHLRLSFSALSIDGRLL